MVSPVSPGPSEIARAMRITAGALVVAPLIVAVAVAFAVPPTDEAPSPLLLLAFVVPPLLGAALALAIGRRTTPLAPGESAPERTALARFQSSTILRLVIVEAPFIVVLAASFVLTYGPWPTLVAAPVTSALMFVVGFPTRRTVDRFAQALESGGVRSGLRETFGPA